MIKNVAYKYRIYPDKEQESNLHNTFGCVRFIWNKNVETFNLYTKENPVEFKTSTKLRKDFEFLQNVSAGALQQKEMDFNQFKSQYFNKKRKKKLGRPQFKNKFNDQSYRLPNQKFYIVDNLIWLEKIGKVKIVIDRYIPKDAKLISCTVSRNKVNQYFVSICVEQDVIPKYNKTGNSIGIDLGIKTLLTLSDGTKIENPKYFSKNQTKISRCQRQLSRKKVGSCRFKKNKLRLARMYNDINNQKNWYYHHIANELLKKYDIIGIENLKVSNMLKNHKLAGAISDASWSYLINILTYKADWNNKIIHKCDTYFASSKTCSVCGYVNRDLKLSDRNWICPICGTHHDRDINAAINIENAALKAQGVACAIRTSSLYKSKLDSSEMAISIEMSNKIPLSN